MYFDAHCDITWVTWNIWLKNHLFSMLYIGFPFDKEMGCNRFIDWIWGHVSILGASFRDCFRICLQVTSVFWFFFFYHWIVQLLLNLDAYIHGYGIMPYVLFYAYIMFISSTLVQSVCRAFCASQRRTTSVLFH